MNEGDAALSFPKKILFIIPKANPLRSALATQQRQLVTDMSWACLHQNHPKMNELASTSFSFVLWVRLTVNFQLGATNRLKQARCASWLVVEHTGTLPKKCFDLRKCVVIALSAQSRGRLICIQSPLNLHLRRVAPDRLPIDGVSIFNFRTEAERPRPRESERCVTDCACFRCTSVFSKVRRSANEPKPNHLNA